MTRLRDASIRTKLALGFGLALGLVVAVGAIGITQLQAQNRFATHLAKVTLPEIILLGEIKGLISEHRWLAARRIETMNFAQLEEIAEAMDAVGDRLRSDMRAYAAITDSSEERRHRGHFVEEWAAYEESLASVQQRVEIGEITESWEQFQTETLVALEAAVEHVDELLANSKQAAIAATDQARAIYVVFLSLTALTILAAMVAMGGGVSWVARHVSQPILRVSEAMRRLTAGDVSAVPDGGSDRKDEIGTLMAAAAGYRTSLVESRRLADEAELERQRFALAVSSMPIGLSMFDGERRLIVANARYRETYHLTDDLTRPGTSFESILDRRIETGQFEGDDPIAFRKDVLAHIDSRETTKRLQSYRDGRIYSIIVQPMLVGGWVSTHEDVTAQHQAEQKIAHLAEEAELERQRLEAAISNMPIGLSMFDGEKRLIVANARYRDMYRMPDDLVRPGTALEAIIDYRIASAQFNGDDGAKFREDILSYVGRREISRDLRRLTDGRIISNIVQPIRGGGWVTTHEDVTAQHKAETKIAHLAEEAERDRQRLRAAVSNMPIGLVMFDADKRLIISNESYAKIYQVPPELLKPGTSLRAILEQRAESGLYGGGDPDSYVDEQMTITDRREPWRLVKQFTDGRVLSIRNQPIAEGGWVSLHEDLTDLRKAETQIAHMTHYDGLTDLPNRLLFGERVDEALAERGAGEALAILCLGLDHFKKVNDTLGHPTGDTVLRIAAERLRESVRDEDVIARLGGDEFAVIQVGTGQPQGAHALAQRIIEKLSAPYIIDDDQAVIGVSVGIAIAPADGNDADRLLKNGGLALERAKADGRGLYRFFEPEMDALMQARRALEIDLRNALDHDEFELFYQPLINLNSNRITGFEALLRWRHPERGMVSPGEFIPVAEETGLIVPIGEWVLKQACQDAMSWPPEITVAVNLSPVQFRSARLMQSVVGALDVSRLAPTRLGLEITEGVLLADTEGTLAMLHQFRALGAHISMDDFGTGYSSLSYLQSFPFDKIKIDRRFIKDIAEDGNSLAIIRAVTGLSASLGIGTTAEGVETVDQLDRVRFEGCTEVQGFLLGRPMPAADALALLGGQQARAASAA